MNTGLRPSIKMADEPGQSFKDILFIWGQHTNKVNTVIDILLILDHPWKGAKQDFSLRELN